MEPIAADRLEALSTRIFAALGVPEADAAWTAKLLVRANLRGHDSHGVIRVPQYVGSIRKGETRPRPAMRLLHETPTTAIEDHDAEAESKEDAEASESKAGKKGPGKLPKLPQKPGSKDSREAAAEALRAWSRRR